MFPPSFCCDLQVMLEPGTMHANGAGPKDPLTEVFHPIRYTTAPPGSFLFQLSNQRVHKSTASFRSATESEFLYEVFPEEHRLEQTRRSTMLRSVDGDRLLYSRICLLDACHQHRRSCSLVFSNVVENRALCRGCSRHLLPPHRKTTRSF